MMIGELAQAMVAPTYSTSVHGTPIPDRQRLFLWDGRTKWIKQAVILLIATLFLQCLWPQAGQAQSIYRDAYFVDQTENSKALGYTDSRKVVRDSQGNLYVAYRKKFKQTRITAYHIFVAKSSDNGRQWQVLNQGQPVETVGDLNQRVPSIAIDSHDKLHVVWYGPDPGAASDEENQIKYVRSTDYGNSWSAWRNIALVPGYQHQAMWQEHPTLFVDQQDHLYVVWEGRDAQYANTAQIKFTHSVDGGLSWQSLTNIAPTYASRSRPSLVATSNGTLYVVAYGSVRGTQQILYTMSDDGGQQWLRWQPIAASSQDQRHISVAVDTQDGLHVVWRQPPFRLQDQFDTSAQIYYASYTDRQWSTPVRVGPHRGVAQTYPSIALDHTGMIWITWLETQRPYSFPKDDPQTGTLYYVAKNRSGWSSPRTYAVGGTNLYPSLRRNLSATNHAVDVVWLEALSTVNIIRFAELTPPQRFVPALTDQSEIVAARQIMHRIAWQSENNRYTVPFATSAFVAATSQWTRDLQAILLLVVAVSVYVTTKFLIGRLLIIDYDS